MHAFLLQEFNCITLPEGWKEYSSNASTLQDMAKNMALEIKSKEGDDKRKFRELGYIKINPYYVVHIESKEEEKRKTFLIKDEIEEKERERFILLINGEFETTDHDLAHLTNFLNLQAKDDEFAFKRGLIRYPIYEMLHTVSEIIQHRRIAYTINFTGKRKLTYRNYTSDNKITVNPEDGWFKINDVETKYNGYLPTATKEDLCKFRREKCFLFSDRLERNLATVLDSVQIKDTWKDCELQIYLDRKIVNLLCGRGEEKKTRNIIINKVGDKIAIQKTIRI